MTSVADGSIAAIRCEADFLRQVHRAQLLRVALKPVAWLDSKCLCVNSVSTAALASARKARLASRAGEKKPGAKARFVGARRARSSGCYALFSCS